MAEGNGADVGSMYGLLVEIGKAVSRHDAVLERHSAVLEQHSAMLARLTELVSSHDQRLRNLEETTAGTRADIADLRQTVIAYHSSVIGQGMLVSELEGRVQRVESHLDLPPFVHR